MGISRIESARSWTWGLVAHTLTALVRASLFKMESWGGGYRFFMMAHRWRQTEVAGHPRRSVGCCSINMGSGSFSWMMPGGLQLSRCFGVYGRSPWWRHKSCWLGSRGSWWLGLLAKCDYWLRHSWRRGSKVKSGDWRSILLPSSCRCRCRRAGEDAGSGGGVARIEIDE